MTSVQEHINNRVHERKEKAFYNKILLSAFISLIITGLMGYLFRGITDLPNDIVFLLGIAIYLFILYVVILLTNIRTIIGK